MGKLPILLSPDKQRNNKPPDKSPNKSPNKHSNNKSAAKSHFMTL